MTRWEVVVELVPVLVVGGRIVGFRLDGGAVLVSKGNLNVPFRGLGAVERGAI